MRKVAFLTRSFDEFNYVQREPFSGLGKPEALKHELSGLWSRRITKEHRLVYSVSDQEIVIISCKFHY
jgi:toxin YoeB